MRLDEPIEASGSFWQPEEPDAQFSGVLRITESGRATLELRGAIFNVPAGDAHRFVGVVDRLGAVTLDNVIPLHLLLLAHRRCGASM